MGDRRTVLSLGEGSTMAGRRHVLNRTRVISLLITVIVIAAEVPLAVLAFRDRVLWAYGLFELLLAVLVTSMAMAVIGDDDEPPRPGGGYQGDGGAGLGGL
ncbi:hypothetical protein ACF1G0_04460 [Streptomyces sp. NPDC013953]|uniref:hypothetical protein n=1 Tax=Streptomyces sp. NPDC013953 TaxID=3364868 RepID=UPI0036F91E83